MSIVLCGPNCSTEQKNSTGGCGDPQKSYVGAVLATWERNGYSDSDFYALVWDEATLTCKTIEYASTRGWTYHNSAYADATEAVSAKARASYTGEVRAHFVRAADAEAAKIGVGDVVRSTTKRGKNVGVEGMVRRIDVDGYKSTHYATYYRYAVEVIGESARRWLSSDAVVKVNLSEVDIVSVVAAADAWLATANWRSLHEAGANLALAALGRCGSVSPSGPSGPEA